MSADRPFTRENLDSYLKELAKEFRKKNGTRMPAEIIKRYDEIDEKFCLSEISAPMAK